ncbi:hypothetical protein CH063_02739 [Colletotrichum higginsianum]|uniref:Uncharacterized protein n=1 Tax=Colletotrichum higginsianum (strain IMI 349063) TaxID=759273 RepID=H1VP78_COLHI|nr:hypothetical protein CH063_02739 [Colletotrichum higginsianum]
MSDAVKTFLQAANGLVDSIENEDDRVRVLSTLHELVGKIESPWDTLVRLSLSQVSRPSSGVDEPSESDLTNASVLAHDISRVGSTQGFATLRAMATERKLADDKRPAGRPR